MVEASASLSENASVILKERYKGPSDNTPEDIFRRVASFVAKAENKYKSNGNTGWEERFFNMMNQLRFLPNSPCLRNAGAYDGSLSGCYVVPIDDCMQDLSGNQVGIADAATAAIMIQKYGGGTGFSGGRLRPRGDEIRSTHKAACGPVEVLKYLNAASNLVTQAAFRAGANMFILPVSHPDILEFIDCKTADPERLNRFNISVGLTDVFLASLEEDGYYPLVNPRSGFDVGALSAQEVMTRIAAAAWKTGDPGIFNLSLANKRNPDSHRVRIEATNPCSEQTLPPWGSCTLGSIDISKFVLSDGRFDVPSFREIVELAVRFLDDVITMNKHPLYEIQEQSNNDRRIGLGIMGWHDFLILQGISYASQEAIGAAKHIGSIFQSTAEEASVELAKERGPYPWFDGSPRQKGGGSPIRNATRTNMAPTGTISIIAGCSSGIEPRFGLANWRKYYNPHEEQFKTFPEPEVSPAFEAVAKTNGFWDPNLIQSLADGQPLREWAGHNISEDTLEVLATATEISPDHHISMQAAWQHNVDNAISKTINMPNESTSEDVRKAFISSLGAGCLSTTIYRDGSRDNQILTNGKQEKLPSTLGSADGRRRLPDERNSVTKKLDVPGFEGYLTIGLFEDGTPGEIFVSSKEGSTVGGLLDAWATAVSLSIQHGTPLATLTQKMRNMRFEPAGMTGYKAIPVVTSIVDYVGHYLEQKYLNGEVPKPEATGMICPRCSGQMVTQMGCLLCEACGFERCG